MPAVAVQSNRTSWPQDHTPSPGRPIFSKWSPCGYTGPSHSPQHETTLNGHPGLRPTSSGLLQGSPWDSISLCPSPVTDPEHPHTTSSTLKSGSWGIASVLTRKWELGEGSPTGWLSLRSHCCQELVSGGKGRRTAIVQTITRWTGLVCQWADMCGGGGVGGGSQALEGNGELLQVAVCKVQLMLWGNLTSYMGKPQAPPAPAPAPGRL